VGAQGRQLVRHGPDRGRLRHRPFNWAEAVGAHTIDAVVFNEVDGETLVLDRHLDVHRGDSPAPVCFVPGKGTIDRTFSALTLRHAFGDHVARYAGLRAAQALMSAITSPGTPDCAPPKRSWATRASTTAGTYTNRPTLDELAVSVQGFSYRRLSTTAHPATPHDATNAR
jgi:hypothetical protein